MNAIGELNATKPERNFAQFIENSHYINSLISLSLGKLLILTGMSCVGKSYFARSLTTLHPTYEHIEVDKIIDLVIRNSLILLLKDSEELLNQYLTLYSLMGSAIHLHIFFDEYFELNFSSDTTTIRTINSEFLHNITDTIRLKKDYLETSIREGVAKTLHNQVRQLVCWGKIAVLDIVANYDILQSFRVYRPSSVTFYEPLEALSKALLKRNQEAIKTNNLKEVRFPQTTHSQWKLFFTRKKICDTTPGILTTEYSTFTEVIRKDIESMRKLGIFSKNTSPTYAHEEASRLELLYNQKNKLKPLTSTHLFLSRTEHTNYICMAALEQLINNPGKIENLTAELLPAIIILDGMSASGKTTVATMFRALFANSDLIGRSEGQRRVLSELLPKSLSEKNTFGDNLFNYARNNQCQPFRTSFPEIDGISTDYLDSVSKFCEENAHRVFQTEEADAANSATRSLNLGNFAILDNLIFKQDLSAFKSSKPFIVLVYCPFNKLIEHIRSRIDAAFKENNPAKWRNPFVLYKSFTTFYGPLNPHNTLKPIEILNKEAVLVTLNKLCDEFFVESYGLVRSQYIQEILEKLNLNKEDTCFIYPQLNKPDMIINTYDGPAENVIKIAKNIRRVQRKMAIHPKLNIENNDRGITWTK